MVKEQHQFYNLVYVVFERTLISLTQTLDQTLSKGSIAEKCFKIYCVSKMASVNSVSSGNKFVRINHIIRCRS